MEKPRLQKLYVEEIRSKLLKELNLSNIMEVPKINKIVLNVGVKEAVDDSKVLQVVQTAIEKIAGQKTVKTFARKSIAGFKIREDMPIGVKVTLRNVNMYEFLDRFINLAMPSIRDFQGIKPGFDGRGNLNIGIKEWMIFPELDLSTFDKMHGLNVTIETSTNNDKHAFELLKKFNMPFKK
ncbi:MAG: 50S ribosomal protein L5 [Candidatus Babeliales bacterium]|nr:50S ribosomal protein L5 [Candidatus Babeliales bacterium]